MCSSAVSMVNIVAQPAVPGCMVSAACEMEEEILLTTILHTDHRRGQHSGKAGAQSAKAGGWSAEAGEC